MANTTPLQKFLDYIDAHLDRELPPLTEYGADVFRRDVRLVLPFLPAIILSGGWRDSTEPPVATAIEALTVAARKDTLSSEAAYLADDPDTITADDREAHYLTGLIVGLAIAKVL